MTRIPFAPVLATITFTACGPQTFRAEIEDNVPRPRSMPAATAGTLRLLIEAEVVELDDHTAAEPWLKACKIEGISEEGLQRIASASLTDHGFATTLDPREAHDATLVLALAPGHTFG